MKPRALFGAKCRAVGPSVLIASFLVMAATLGSTAQATAIGGPPIKLISWHTFNVGGWNWGSNEVDLVGIIKNTGSVTADNVVIHVAYKTPDGYFINKWDVPTLLSRVDSEKESTFCSTYIPSAPSGDTLTITSISDQVSKWPANTNFAVAPTPNPSTSSWPPNTVYGVNGTMTNDNRSAVLYYDATNPNGVRASNWITAIASFYDVSGQIITAGSSYLQPPTPADLAKYWLDPGADSAFLH